MNKKKKVLALILTLTICFSIAVICFSWYKYNQNNRVGIGIQIIYNEDGDSFIDDFVYSYNPDKISVKTKQHLSAFSTDSEEYHKQFKEKYEAPYYVKAKIDTSKGKTTVSYSGTAKNKENGKIEDINKLYVYDFVLIRYPEDLQRTKEVANISQLSFSSSNGLPSRTSTISPLTDDCKEHKLDKKAADAYVGFDTKGTLNPTSTVFKIIKKANGAIHTVRLIWYFNDKQITAIIDPNSFPDFLFEEQEAISTVNGYEVGVKKYIENSDLGEIDIGIKKGTKGIWLYSNAEKSEELNEIFNLFLSSKE